MGHYQDSYDYDAEQAVKRQALEKKKQRLAAQAEFPNVMKNFKDVKKSVKHSLPHFNDTLKSQLETKVNELQSLLELYGYLLNDDEV